MSSFYIGGFSDFFDNIGLGSTANTVLSLVLITVLITSCIAFAFGILMYVFESIGIYTMAKRRGIKAPGLAWVPIASIWTEGSLADQYYRKATGKDPKLRSKLLTLTIIFYVLLPVLYAVSVIFMLLSFNARIDFLEGVDMNSAGLIIAFFVFSVVFLAFEIVYLVLLYKTIYRVYRSCSPGSATALLILSIFFNVIIAFAMFALRKKDGGFEQIRDREIPNAGEAGSEA